MNSGKELEIKSTAIDSEEQVTDLGIMMSNKDTFTLHIWNTLKGQRQDGMGAESVSVVEALLTY